jgi:hypothetical protein
LFLALLAQLSVGHDLWPVFLAGSALFALVGGTLIVLGARIRQGDLVLGGVGVLAAVLLSFVVVLATEKLGGPGPTLRVLAIHATDRQTGEPVPAATLYILSSNEEQPESLGRTDDSGVAQVSYTFLWFGSSSLLGDRGSVPVWQTLMVKAPGYHTLRVPLRRHVGGRFDLYQPSLPTVEVALEKATP